MSDKQQGFSSSFGAIMAAVGSAVGLGNIWRFPYIMGQYGGGAFLLVYLAFVFLIGMVLMMTEFVIGRRSQHTPAKAFVYNRPDRKGWRFLGYLCVFTCLMIISQYVVLSGWTTNYIVDSATGTLASLQTSEIGTHFSNFITHPWLPVMYLIIFTVITAVIILGGVQKGIEAVSKVLMPVLLVLVLVLCVRSITLPNSSVGLSYLFSPDFSKLSGEGVLAALGQALFSLSVGMGTMIVYGSYIPANDNIFKTAMLITASDTLIAVLAGVAIFPAVFSFGQDPASGPGLVFQVLPTVFNSMGGIGTVFAVMFFFLLALAALTSAISLLETIVAWLCESSSVNRYKSTIIVTLVVLAVGSVCALSDGLLGGVKILNKSIFGFVDDLNSIYLPPICAIGTVIFFGWQMKKEDIIDELSNHGALKIGYFKAFYFLVRYVAPIALLVVLFTSIYASLFPNN